MKKLAMAILAIGLCSGVARAANPFSVDVYVQIQNLSIAVTSSTMYDYGIQQFAVNAVQGTKFTFQNNGNASEQFQFGVNAAASNALTAGGGLWTLVTAAPAAEQVRLGLVLKTTAAVAGDFTYAAPQDGLSTSFVTAGTTSPSTFVADAGSINPVAVSGTRDGYTQLFTPTTTAQFGKVRVVLQANAIP
jgi:hypothetical protein